MNHINCIDYVNYTNVTDYANYKVDTNHTENIKILWVKGYTTLRKTHGSSSMAREYTTLGKTHKNSKGPVSPIESLRPV